MFEFYLGLGGGVSRHYGASRSSHVMRYCTNIVSIIHTTYLPMHCTKMNEYHILLPKFIWFYNIYFFWFQEAKCAYCIIVMAVYWITEALPIAVTSLLPIILFPMVGLLSAKDVSNKYLNVSTVYKFWEPNFTSFMQLSHITHCSLSINKRHPSPHLLKNKSTR